MNVLLVTNNPKLVKIFDNPLFQEYSVLDFVINKNNLAESLNSFNMADEHIDIVVIFENAEGEININDITNVKINYPNIRIVYFAGNVGLTDYKKQSCIANLVQAGVYDIEIGNKIEPTMLFNILECPKTYDNVKDYLKYLNVDNFNQSNGYKNIIVCSSVKPGSGKSTLAVNLALAIAKYGQKKPNGNPPRVAIVEGDLTNLSVGTLLHLTNSQYNLHTALKEISKVVSADGVITGTDEQIDAVKKYVRRCFVKYSPVPNLYAMVASTIPVKDIMQINPFQYYFLIECIVGAFDVMIIDANSSLEHKTTGPLFQLAGKCYFVFDMDYNNIQNNVRYKEELKKVGIEEKIKYILNKDISLNKQKDFLEDINYFIEGIGQLGLNIDTKIPYVDESLMANSVYDGIPIILSKDPKVKDAKDAIIEIANENWKIDRNAIEEEAKEELVKKNMKNNKRKNKIIAFLNNQ